MPDTPEAQQSTMEAWGAWFDALGAAVVDGGNPCGAAKTVTSSGMVEDGATAGLTGYSLLTAESLSAAAEMARGCPILASGGSVEVHETFDAV